MTLRRNVIANYLGQGWTGVIGIVLIPVYIRLLGIEAYGLVGIFGVLQSSMSLLDMGMTPTLNREMARFQGGARSPESIRDLLRSLEVIYICIGVVIVAVITLAAPWLAAHWLKVEKLPHSLVAETLVIMAFVIALRAWEQAYRGAIQGMQRQVWLNAVQAGFATLRWVGVLGILYWVSNTIAAFFIWQGLVSILTVIVYGWQTHRWMPAIARRARFSLEALREVAHFTGALAATTLVSIVLTQVDKLILSRLFTLDVFGYYTLATTAAAVLAPFVYPMSYALYPRLSEQLAQGDEAGAAQTYHKASQFVSALIVPVAVMLAFFARMVLTAWTENPALAAQVAPILRFQILGNLCNGLMIAPGMLALAYGWAGLSLRINLGALIFIVPTLLLAVPAYGPVGASAVWLVLNMGYVLIAIPILHTRILRTQMWRWYREVVILPLLAAVPAAALLAAVIPANLGRIATFAVLAAAGALVMALVFLVMPAMRAIVLQQLGGWRRRQV